MVEDPGDLAAARGRASWSTAAFLGDRELEALFAKFAQIKRDAPALPFVKQRRVEHEKRVKTGLFGSRLEKETRYESDEVARGWPILAIGHHFSACISKLETTPVWFGLAIDADGYPWFAQHAWRAEGYWGQLFTDQMLRINGRAGDPVAPEREFLGRPTAESSPVVWGYTIEADGRKVPYTSGGTSDPNALRSAIMSFCRTREQAVSGDGVPAEIARAMGISLPNET